MIRTKYLPLCTIALLAACHGDSSQAPSTSLAQTHRNAPAVVKRGPTRDELTAGMVEAVTVGKSTVPVAVKFDLPGRPTVGQAFDVVIAVMPDIAADSAVLSVTGSENLHLAEGGGTVEMPAVEPAQVYRHDMKVSASADGVQLLALTVALKHDEITETRSFTVPLIVGLSN